MQLFKRKKTISDHKETPFPIIIGGCHRSGTTLLRRILDSHSKINCPPEVKFFRDFYGDYFSDELSHLRFFDTVRQTGLNNDELLGIFGEAFVKCHALAAAKSGKPRWADKNPENVLYLANWWKLLDGKFFFILVIRNPLDTLASMKEAKFPKTLPPGFEELVAVYLKYIEAGLKFAKQQPEISYIIQYEKLVADPSSVVGNLMEFIGEKYEANMITAFNSTKRKSGIEDQKISGTKSIHSGSIERWKNDLSDEEIAYVRKKCSKVMKRFAY